MEYYTWVLSFHIVAVLSWMAMLFYLPRLFVYHIENIDKKEFVDIVTVQESKIYKFIGHPAMWFTIFSGITMIYINPALISQDWFHAKLLMLVFLIAYSFSLNYYRKQLANGKCKKSGKFFRMYNEQPTLLAILIVTYVITKNFSLLFTIIMILFFSFISYMILKTKKDKS
ncbi:protoporphyrinogen oxidase HemJ [Aliarcobacter thereius]|uniref:Protoporphyrinogen IX oxidase n=1 Tax=Aliarcobacter thereius TaxID=544718 RepID=A0A5R9H1Q9_9BACT|nr:protoporphyrinogen oxidase HemJ [Aliarcobacter thereius]TLS72635.1 protoporphyrinogen oxidase HemJ [Aliarcobacter thereius]TLT07728.1 protoporphyrinogen oxidase HemJ [Aliarcobacter thereius]